MPFIVEDDTGRVLVEPDNAKFCLAEEWIQDLDSIPDDPAPRRFVTSQTRFSARRRTGNGTTSPD
ncbi:hypothetical protein [Halorussus aquaticus]|uniref:Uncharacterized protein n=1 Tax=Halorussus aquaticus TaxID=2953748 RepID=A0ABD5Q6Q6_9EURY|nr:hypothetical protein [Halorussus aquaticus]